MLSIVGQIVVAAFGFMLPVLETLLLRQKTVSRSCMFSFFYFRIRAVTCFGFATSRSMSIDRVGSVFIRIISP